VGEESMVARQDLDEGARLIQELDGAGFPITASFWAYDPGAEHPRLIIAVPDEKVKSFRDGYEEIRKAIAVNDIEMPLSRVSLMLDDDPAISNIRALADADYRDLVQAAVGSAEIGGHIYDDIRVYKNDALRYERELFAALQRVRPPATVIRRELRVDERWTFDFLLDDGVRVAAIEAKRLPRPVNAADLEQEAALLLRAYVGMRRPVSLVVVSRSGFTETAIAAAVGSPVSEEIHLVRWVDSSDDGKLRRALAEALNPSRP
jgi:hypothetical protein